MTMSMTRVGRVIVEDSATSRDAEPRTVWTSQPS
jgi:hypothetical protein